MREPVEIEVASLLDEAASRELVTEIGQAVERAHRGERTTWLTYNGLRCAAIVPLEVGRVMDPDELPPAGGGGAVRPYIEITAEPGTVIARGGGNAEDNSFTPVGEPG